MPRQSKAETTKRHALELCQFNSRVSLDELLLLELLIDQELKRQDFPSQRLVNAKEITARLKKYQKEIENVACGS